MELRIAVIAHSGKSLDGGLPELRRRLAGHDVIWYEVPKSRKAPAKVRKALRHRLDVLLLWGGDGLVQRCVDALDGCDVPVAIVPAGTANLFARNLGIPVDLAEAVDVALYGTRRRVDLGRVNGERFGVMAGAGFDAEMIDAVGGRLKRRLGRLAYLWTGARAMRVPPVRTKIDVDGERWFTGDATCVLVGNVPKVFGAVEVFDGADPADGLLDIGVTTATDPVEWSRTLTTMSTGPSDRSPFVETTRGRRITVKLATQRRLELDGGARPTTRRLKIKVLPSALTVCVPPSA